MTLGKSILQYIDDIKSGNTTCEEFLSETFEHIKKNDERLHAYLSLNDNALDQARIIDKKIRANYNPASIIKQLNDLPEDDRAVFDGYAHIIDATNGRDDLTP